jgi:hypothetical protein
MSRALLVLLIAGLSCWAALALPAALIVGPDALACSGLALVVCLVPAAITLALGWRMDRKDAAYQLGAVLGGTGIRMFGVLAAAAAVYLLVPYFRQPQFLIWIVVFYLLTLVLDVRLLLVGLPSNRGGVSGASR